MAVDSYNDDEPTSKAPRGPDADQNTAAQSASETKNDHAEAAGQEQNNDDDARDEEEEEEDDEDDIDFNLGNGPSTTLTHHDNNSHNEHRNQHDDHHGEKPTHSGPPAPVSHSKGPNAKEDG